MSVHKIDPQVGRGGLPAGRVGMGCRPLVGHVERPSVVEFVRAAPGPVPIKITQTKQPLARLTQRPLLATRPAVAAAFQSVHRSWGKPPAGVVAEEPRGPSSSVASSRKRGRIHGDAIDHGTGCCCKPHRCPLELWREDFARQIRTPEKPYPCSLGVQQLCAGSPRTGTSIRPRWPRSGLLHQTPQSTLFHI